jgi:hypothetical protein
MVSDLPSGEKGAAIAYAVAEYETGSQAAQKALAILDDYALPSSIPISAVSNFRLAINTETAEAQHVAYDPEVVSRYNNPSTHYKNKSVHVQYIARYSRTIITALTAYGGCIYQFFIITNTRFKH